jgi:hypothetical protein
MFIRLLSLNWDWQVRPSKESHWQPNSKSRKWLCWPLLSSWLLSLNRSGHDADQNEALAIWRKCYIVSKFIIWYNNKVKRNKWLILMIRLRFSLLPICHNPLCRSSYKLHANLSRSMSAKAWVRFAVTDSQYSSSASHKGKRRIGWHDMTWSRSWLRFRIST